MNIRFGSDWLADETTRVSQFTIDGSQLVQEADFLRATHALFIARRNRRRTITFQTDRLFGTIQAAESFIFQHYEDVGDQDDLMIRIGLPGEGTLDVTFPDAVLESVQHQPPIGVTILSRYTFRVSAFSGIAVSPPDDEFESGTFDIPNGQAFVVVTGLALSASPDQVLVTVRKPNNGLTLVASVDGSTITSGGWTAWFSGNTDSANYKLDWVALFT